jgi:hypothetical protein
MRRAIVLALALAGTALVTLVVLWAVQDHDYPSSAAQPPPLFFTKVITVRPGSTACSSDVTVESHSEQARFKVGTASQPGPALRVTLRWLGHRQTHAVPSGYVDNSVLGVGLEPPPGPRLATLCVRNVGRIPAFLYAADSARPPGREVFAGDASRSITRVDGRPVSSTFDLAFYESSPHSILDRLSTTMTRVAVLRPIGAWFAWLLLVLFGVGVPVGVGWALLRSAAGRDGHGL